jgi:uncharacterized protein (TIGR04255 family)
MDTKEHLPNAPLVQVACEVRFHGDLSLYEAWGRFQREIRGDFPKLFVPPAAPGVPPLTQAMKLASIGGEDAILMAINSFAFSTGRYDTFRSFREKLSGIQSAFFRCCELDEMTRFGIRYVNILPPACDDGTLGPRIHPCLRLELSGLTADGTWAGQPQFVAEKTAGRCTLRTALMAIQGPTFEAPPGSVPPISPVLSSGVQLDLDCYRDTGCRVADLPALLEEAHATIEKAFFGMISDEYHAYLKGSVD